MEWLPPLTPEYTLAGLFSVGAVAALAFTLLWVAVGGHEVTLRWATLTLVLATFSALFWLEPLLEEYV